MSGLTFTAEDYLAPQWSAQPSHNFYFQIIKQGSLLGKLPVKKKAFNLIGRLQDLCDIPIDNHTVSRKHAILQFSNKQPYPFIFDLGGTHGTHINREKVPPRTYHTLKPFDNVKFGISSRIYIFRSPELEAQIEMEQEQKDNKFTQLLEEKQKELTKQQIKQKYLSLLGQQHNNGLSRNFKGQEQQRYDGIDWGIADQREVYNHKNQNEMQLDADILRRLNLDSIQLNKVADLEESQRIYEEIQGELNQLTAKQQRQFGLEEKQRVRKQKMQTKFVEALENLQKNQEWVRTTLFGETIVKGNKLKRIRQRQYDTYGDDEFFDRTLGEKQQYQNKPQQSKIVTSDNYWQLEKELKEKIRAVNVIKKQITEVQKSATIEEEDDDDLDVFMKANNQTLLEENFQMYQKQLDELDAEIKQIKQKLVGTLGESYLEEIIQKVDSKMLLKEQFQKVSHLENEKTGEKKKQQNSSIQQVLAKVKRQSQAVEALENDVDQLDPQIFKIYKQFAQDQFEENKMKNIQNRPVDAEIIQFQKPLVKKRKREGVREENQVVQEESFVDLTKNFK